MFWLTYLINYLSFDIKSTPPTNISYNPVIKLTMTSPLLPSTAISGLKSTQKKQPSTICGAHKLGVLHQTPQFRVGVKDGSRLVKLDSAELWAWSQNSYWVSLGLAIPLPRGQSDAVYIKEVLISKAFRWLEVEDKLKRYPCGKSSWCARIKEKQWIQVWSNTSLTEANPFKFDAREMFFQT